jgi:hypothetical protein
MTPIGTKLTTMNVIIRGCIPGLLSYIVSQVEKKNIKHRIILLLLDCVILNIKYDYGNKIWLWDTMIMGIKCSASWSTKGGLFAMFIDSTIILFDPYVEIKYWICKDVYSEYKTFV